MSLLPTVSDIPTGLVEDGRRTRTLDDVADNYTDAAETAQLFTSWGWQGNAVASFALPSGQQARSGEVNGVYVSIHRFGDASSARAALDHSLVEQAAGTPLQEVTAPPFGEYTRALYGALDYGNEITLLTQQGDLLIRVSAAMLDGNPTPQAEAIMESILARAGAGTAAGNDAVTMTASGDMVPEAFAGTWSGQMAQVNPDATWPVTIVLTGGGVGAVVGTSDYPTYACGGDLYLEQVVEDAVAVVERLTRGQDACLGDGTVTLTLRGDGDLNFHWIGLRNDGTASTATGTLQREG